MSCYDSSMNTAQGGILKHYVILVFPILATQLLCHVCGVAYGYVYCNAIQGDW